MSEGKELDPLAKTSDERRDFLKKLAIAAAFAAPTVATFSLDGVRKKAMAQSVYGQPVVLSVEPGPGPVNQATVLFSQPMDTGVGSGNDSARTILACRQYSTNPTVTGIWSWDGDTKQIFDFSGAYCINQSVDIALSYNMGPCSEKFRGKNGLELVPWSGMVTISGSTGQCKQ